MLTGYDESRWLFGKKKDALVKSFATNRSGRYIYLLQTSGGSHFSWTRLW